MGDFQPTLMWSPQGVEVTVQSPGELAEREAEGYRLTPHKPAPVDAPLPDVLDDPDGVPPVPVDAEPDADPFDTEPTFGPPGDDTHEKRKARKK